MSPSSDPRRAVIIHAIMDAVDAHPDRDPSPGQMADSILDRLDAPIDIDGSDPDLATTLSEALEEGVPSSVVGQALCHIDRFRSELCAPPEVAGS